jgi:putative transposase
MRPKLPKLAALMDDAESDVLAYMTFPKEHRGKLHSTNPIERLNGETKRRTTVADIFPNEAAITRLVGAILMEQSDEWAEQAKVPAMRSVVGKRSGGRPAHPLHDT